jgi:asparagine synthase (glutamine-hydrolysing)
MPGIYGLANKVDPQNDILRMSKVMMTHNHFVQDSIFIDSLNRVAASRTHLGVEQPSGMHKNSKNISVWVEGEAYNLEWVSKQLKLNGKSLPELLIDAEESGQLKPCLRLLDGFFCASIYNPSSQKIKLVSDRYGMRLMYYYHRDGILGWGSEVKALLAINGLNKEIDDTSFDCFMDLGYLLGEHTWFEHIKLMRPSSIYTYSILDNSLIQEYYWTWSEINKHKISLNDSVDELGNRFIEAVNIRFKESEKFSVSLSGGMDSRAIFAAIDGIHPDFAGYAYTFGIPNSEDILIAKEVVNLSKWNHAIFHFSEENWFEPRISRVWDTDGMKNMMHMHGSEFLPEVSTRANYNLNGYLGGEAFGDSYQAAHGYRALNKRIDRNLANVLYLRYASLTNYSDSYYDIDHIEPFHFMNRSRRLINMGIVNAGTHLQQRMPMMDNGVLDLLFSLPDEYRCENIIYSQMVHRFFPKYFSTIPWQKTGKPAGVVKKLTYFERFLRKSQHIASKFGYNKTNTDYTNYPDWIRKNQVTEKLLAILGNKNAKYRSLTSDDLSKKWLEPHLNNPRHNHADKILRATTIEIYLNKALDL